MKFTKMSLVAALLVGSSAFAIENTKVSGDANLFYHTADAGSNDFFSKDGSATDVGVNINLTTDLMKNDSVAVSAGAGYTVLTTLGLENNLVGSVWGGAHTATAGTGASYGGALGGAKVENANWFNEAWVAATAGKTTVKLGRMELDTPLAFTEKWTIEKNTFEAAVLINQDIPDTTVVAAYIGNGNGTENFGQNLQSNVYGLGLAAGGVVNGGGTFGTYGTNGAYAIAAINNSWKPLTAQVWYYDVLRLATAFWLQGDIDAAEFGVDGLTVGGQYTSLTAEGANTENTAMAGMIGYEMKDTVAARIAYSHAGKGGALANTGFNTATNMGTAQTKLYTEVWWNYGQVTQKGAKSLNLTVEAPTSVADLGLYFTNVTNKTASKDLTELTATASKSVGPVDASVAYIYTKFDGSDAVNALQVYLTMNF